MEKVKNILKIVGLSLFILECVIGIIFVLGLKGAIEQNFTPENVNRVLTIIEAQQSLDREKLGVK